MGKRHRYALHPNANEAVIGVYAPTDHVNRACVGSLPLYIRARTFQQRQILLQGSFLRVVAGNRPAKRSNRLRRSPNQCGVLRGQMAKVEQGEVRRIHLLGTRENTGVLLLASPERTPSDAPLAAAFYDRKPTYSNGA